MEKGRPIRPSEVAEAKVSVLPPQIFDIFNRLIALGMTQSSATVLQDDVINAILEEMDTKEEPVTRADIFKNGWLNVEEVYREAGWKVQYVKPDYTESFNAYFKFSY